MTVRIDPCFDVYSVAYDSADLNGTYSREVRALKKSLPIPYREIQRLQNFAYRGTRWHDADVPTPACCRHVTTITVGPVRIDLHHVDDGQILVMPRPTDWDDFASFSPNVCLSRSRSVDDAVEQTVMWLVQDAGEAAHIAIIGASQAGYIGFSLGIALVERIPSIANRIFITTFNSAPLIDYSSEIESAIGALTTNYRTAFPDAAPNLLGYRLGDYVTMLGPLPGTTHEVSIQDVGPALSDEKIATFSYGSLHADLYLVPENEDFWQTKDISETARANSGLGYAAAMASLSGNHSVEKASGIARLVADTLLQEARKLDVRGVDPCLEAQLANLAEFAKRRTRSLRWKVIGILCDQLLRGLHHPCGSATLRGTELLAGIAFRGLSISLLAMERYFGTASRTNSRR